MSGLRTLLQQLKILKVLLYEENGKLKVNAPKGAVTPEIRDQIRANKEDILAFLQKADQVAGTKKLTISPAPRDGTPIPLSFAQQRLWFVDHMTGPNSHYNMPLGLRFLGMLDASAMERAIEAMIHRHEILRTRFPVIANDPVQEILPETPFVLDVIDMTHLSPAVRKRDLDQLVDAMMHRPFLLAEETSLRVSLVHMDEQDHVLLVNQHHIISDGWSFGIIAAELPSFYRATVFDVASGVMPLKIQYADFTLWQRDQMGEGGLQQQLDYWQQQLAGIPDCIELPTDRPRPTTQTNEGKQHAFFLEKSDLDLLEDMARETGTTLFMVALAAFAATLARYSDQDDIVIGTAIANRNYHEIEPLIGFFVNMLALRCPVGDDPTVKALLAEVRQASLDAQANQDLPFERLVDMLRLKRDNGYSPVFQVGFSLDTRSTAEQEQVSLWPGLKLEQVHAENNMVKDDLKLGLDVMPGYGVYGSIEYKTVLFDTSTIAAMARRFMSVVRAFPNNPRIRQIDLLDTAERAELLQSLHQSGTISTHPPFVHQSLETICLAQPHHPALVDLGNPDQEPMDYGTFHQRAKRLAAALQAEGVGPDMAIPVLLPRSLDTLVVFAAVWYAGAAFTPMDVDLTPERLHAILQASGAPFLVSRAGIAADLPPHDTQILDLDELDAHTGRLKPVSLHRDHAAYRIFTSGTTGHPKGVVVTHRNLALYAMDMREHIGLTASDHALLFTNLSFDGSIEQWLTPLLSGATVYMKPTELWDTEKLVRAMRKNRISYVGMTPSYMTAMLHDLEQAGETDPFPDLTCLEMGGEIMPISLVQAFNRLTHGRARLFNAYGPTETTVAVTVHLVDMDADQVPLGRPRPGRTIYVLDRYMNLVPLGLPGQLYVGGATVSRGYSGAARLTAPVYVPNPFSDDAGSRLYATGDLVRMDKTGVLHYLGRIDHQVKLRGFRIELAEIEGRLRRFPQLKDAVVLMHDLPEVGAVLCAYLLSEETNHATLIELVRNRLREHLPAYMVPSAYTVLDVFPKTPSGKVDLRALPLPNQTRTAMVLPRNDLETKLAAIWCEVLHLEQVGVTEEFFELGGHSLSATRVAARIREEFGIDLPVRDLFLAPTIERLSKLVQSGESIVATGTMRIQPVPRSQPVPLSYQQERLWILDRVKGVGAAYNLPQNLRLRGPLAVAAMDRGFQALMQRHEVLNMVVDASGDALTAAFLPVPDQVVTVIDLSGLPRVDADTAQKHLTAQEGGRHFDLERDRLMTVKLFRLTPAEHVLSMNLQHMLSDGWSNDVLNREVMMLYMAALTRRPAPLSPLPFQYGDYAHAQRQWLRGEVWEERFDFWRNLLADVPTLQLPTDDPRPATLTYEGGRSDLLVPAELLAGLKQLARQENCSLYMVVLSIYALLLSQWSQQNDIAVGTAIAGRNHEGTGDLIGCFMNILVMRCHLDGDPVFTELLARTRTMTLDAYENQDMPFEKLVAALELPPDTSRNPLFQAYFNLINTPRSRKETGTPGIEPVQGKSELTSKFDLALYGVEMGDVLLLQLLYNRNLFQQTTVDKAVGRLQALIVAVTDSPNQPLSAYA